MRRVFVVVLLVTVCGGSAHAAAPEPVDLPQGDIFTPSGRLTPLHSGTTYQASAFPIPIRVTAIGGGWSGSQWKANTWPPEEIARRHLHCPQVCKPPYFGWVTLGKGSTTSVPRALIVIVAGYDSNPSVAATVAALQRGKGVSLDTPVTTTFAGLHATELDGQTTGALHYFTPFSPPSHGAAGSSADAIEMKGPGHPFRFIVLDARGKTVVVLIGSLVVGVDQFPQLLNNAQGVLESVKFP